MTIEQQIQRAIQSALQSALAASEISATVVAEKVHAGDEGEPENEQYPAVVIVTSTPVPDGNKSHILRVPCFIRAMSYLPDARTKQEYAELCQIIFFALQDTEEWQEFPDEDIRADIAAITIESGEEPTVDAGGMVVQETRCAVHACYINTIEE